MSGVANSSQSAVEAALRNYAIERGGALEAIGSSTDPSEALLITDSGNHITVMYPGEFVQWDDASQFLSRTLDTSVFSLHIHDEDLWMYVLFSKGEQVDQFNPISNYWQRKMPKVRPVRLILGMPITTEENTGLLYSTRFSVTSAGPTAKTRNHKLPNELRF